MPCPGWRRPGSLRAKKGAEVGAVNIRQRFWLLVMDVIVLCGGFGSRAYGWVLQRASDATDWGDGEDCSEEGW
jgi:hypothetical protein